MEHIIKNNINPEKISMLKDLKGSTSVNIFVDDAGEFVLSILIDSPDSKLIIKNMPTVESDGDEYPKLEIEHTTIAVSNYKEAYIGKKVKDVIIINDKATWQKNNDKWIVEIDIGIKIIFEDEELLLIAHDSLAGLLKVVNPKLEQPSSISKLFEEYWSMKTDQLRFLRREEIFV